MALVQHQCLYEDADPSEKGCVANVAQTTDQATIESVQLSFNVVETKELCM